MIFDSRHSVQVPEKDILSFIFDGRSYESERPLFIDADDPSQVITAKQLLSLTKRIGRGLRESAGINTGDVVLICSANRVVIPALMLGILCAGATISGANPTFSSAELSYQIQDSGAKAIFAAEDTVQKIKQCCESLKLPMSRVYLLSLHRSQNGDVGTLGDLLEYGDMDWDRLSTKEQLQNRLAALNYSSGTTGLPKGCEITMYNMVAHCSQFLTLRDHGRKEMRARGEPVPDTETLIAYVPFYHAMGQQIYCINGTKNGDITYVMNAFNFESLLRFISKYRITSIACVPPIVVSFAKHPLMRSTDLSSVRTMSCGAAPLGADIQKQAELAIDPTGRLKIQQAWGMSEATLGATAFAPGETDPEAVGVGYLIPNMQAKIVDDSGRELGYDESGEVLLKGPNVFRGYWNKGQATKDAFSNDGYYKTGDIGMMKRSNILYIVDRKKELIKVKGLQVAPVELEDLLLESPDVADVAVIGVPGEGTELPRAYVVPARPGVDPQAISDFVASRLARYKRLTGGVVFTDVIPKSLSGKILRRELRDRAKREIQGALKAKL